MPSPTAKTRSKARAAARLAAVQALYQQEMEKTPLPQLLTETIVLSALSAPPEVAAATQGSR